MNLQAYLQNKYIYGLPNKICFFIATFGLNENFGKKILFCYIRKNELELTKE